MFNLRKILPLMLVVLFFYPIQAHARADVDHKGEINTRIMKQELLNDGFDEKELLEIYEDIPEVYNIIKSNRLEEWQINNLKNTFKNIRKPDIQSEKTYKVDQNGVVDLGTHLTIIPHSTYSTSNNSSGPHVMTYTNPYYKFYKVTGYVDLPAVSVSYNPNRAHEYNSRPYIMYGAYGNGGGFDAGLVYYEEISSWKLFRNVLGDGWSEKNIALNGNRVYLWMELNGDKSLIKVIDPVSWNEISSMYIPAPSSFSSNPYNVNLTREVALAQFNRLDNGDYLREAHWSQVHYYRKSDGFYTIAEPKYLLSNMDKRYSYDNSMPKYLIGDTLEDKSKITIRPENNYSAEWVDIVLN
ncbi:hypothetical protein ACLGL1_09075 [Peptococcus simiae]|uniref:hypothetical protein n=1 Tax=Peptococcus simiae TaxID=1643805 RepID=UPI00397FCA3A